jgi:hypothetical protein
MVSPAFRICKREKMSLRNMTANDVSHHGKMKNPASPRETGF